MSSPEDSFVLHVPIKLYFYVIFRKFEWVKMGLTT